MIQPRGRTTTGPAPRRSGLALRLSAVSAGLTLIGAAQACAHPDNPASGTPTAESRSVRIEATSVGTAPEPRVYPSIARRGEGATGSSCANVPVPQQPATRPAADAADPDAADPDAADPDAADPDAADPDAAERIRRNLESQNPPTPTRGSVPATAIPGAEACVRLLRVEFSLLTAGSVTPPRDGLIAGELVKVGLTSITVQPGPRFTASTGQVCLLGTLTTEEPTFTIAALLPDGSCPAG